MTGIDARCPHDGGKCHHLCIERNSPCFRMDIGASLTTPWEGFPVESEMPITGPMPSTMETGMADDGWICKRCGATSGNPLKEVDECVHCHGVALDEVHPNAEGLTPQEYHGLMRDAYHNPNHPGIVIKLETNEMMGCGHVGYSKLLPFQTLPEVVIWGSRVFTLAEEGGGEKYAAVYREAFATVAMHVESDLP